MHSGCTSMPRCHSKNWSELSGLSPELLRELVEYGALVPSTRRFRSKPGAIDVQSTQWRFTADCILTVRTVSRLREDFDLDANALSVALTLVERIHGLEAQLRDLQTQLASTAKQTVVQTVRSMQHIVFWHHG